MPLIKSISGLRGTLGDSLLPDIIARNVASFACVLPKGKVIIGRDGRPSGVWIEKIVAGTLAATGFDVEILGIVPTPTIQLAVEHSDASGGISITASHNSKEWNGLKFMNADGVFFDLKENSKMWEVDKFGDFKFVKSQVGGKIYYNDYALDEHIKSILKLPFFTQTVLLSIQEKKYKVVVDAVNSSGSIAIPKLLKEFGCEVIELHCCNNGEFPHTPEPLPKNLKELAEEVKNQKADLGIAVDPDSDRLVLIDETGTSIGEEKTIAIAIESVLKHLDYFKQDINDLSVVVNLSTTRLIDDICQNYNIKLERSAVGEINVVKTMKKNNAIIGGEGSGGVILPACHYGRDSLVGTALSLLLMNKLDSSLNSIINGFTQYHIVKNKCFFQGNLNTLYNSIADLFPNGKILKGDGIKVVFPDSWVHLRASNTEPIVRIIAEDPLKKEAIKLVQTVVNHCNSFHA